MAQVHSSDGCHPGMPIWTWVTPAPFPWFGTFQYHLFLRRKKSLLFWQRWSCYSCWQSKMLTWFDLIKSTYSHQQTRQLVMLRLLYIMIFNWIFDYHDSAMKQLGYVLKKHSWHFNDQYFDLKYLTLHTNFTHQDCDSSCGMLYRMENISTSKGWKIWVQTAADCFTGDRFPSRGLGLIFSLPGTIQYKHLKMFS